MGDIKKAEFYEVKLKSLNEVKEKIKDQQDSFKLIFEFLNTKKLHEI